MVSVWSPMLIRQHEHFGYSAGAQEGSSCLQLSSPLDKSLWVDWSKSPLISVCLFSALEAFPKKIHDSCALAEPMQITHKATQKLAEGSHKNVLLMCGCLLTLSVFWHAHLNANTCLIGLEKRRQKETIKANTVTMNPDLKSLNNLLVMQHI